MYFQFIIVLIKNLRYQQWESDNLLRRILNEFFIDTNIE